MSYVKTVLDLSTAHLTREVAESLTNGTLELPVSVKKDEYGFLIGVGSRDVALYGPIPECLEYALQLAHSLGCSWVMFDRDADKYPGLEAYDW